MIDVVIGNPPYQDATTSGSYTTGSMPLYNEFVESLLDISRYALFLIPSRWMSGGKSVLDGLRNMIVNSKHVKTLVNYEKSEMVFPDFMISGGIQYILFDNSSSYDNSNGYVEFHSIIDTKHGQSRSIMHRPLYEYKCNGQYVVIQDNTAIGIIRKVLDMSQETMEKSVKYNPFKIQTNYIGSRERNEEFNIGVRTGNGDTTYARLADIGNTDYLDYYKVCTGQLASGGGVYGSRTEYTVINKPFILTPGVACTNTYIITSMHSDLSEAENYLKYMRTKFVRFLIGMVLSSIHITPKNFMFVPCIRGGVLTDKELYKQYRLDNNEIEYIEEKIKGMQR